MMLVAEWPARRRAAAISESVNRSASGAQAARRRVVMLGAVTVALWLPVLLDAGAVRSAVAHWPVALTGNAYVSADHWWVLYVRTPLVVISGSLLLLSPGLFLALAFNRAHSIAAWVVSALAMSLVVVSLAAGLVQAARGAPLHGGGFIAVTAACGLAGLSGWAWRLTRGHQLAWPFDHPQARATLVGMLGAPVLLLVALAPKFYWESFNGDGAHAFESARLLLVQGLPFWPAEAGDIASFPGFTSALFAYPASWFIRMFGELEASARFPYLIFVAALFGAIVELAEFGRRGKLGSAEHALIWLALFTYTVSIAFSATYDPYSADIALPATQDTLTVVCMLAFILAALRQQWLWAGLFALLTYTSLPIGVLLIGFWVMALFIVTKPRPWPTAVAVSGIVVACMAFAAIVQLALSALGLPTPGGEYAGGELLRRFAFLQWTDWRRLLFVSVPAGIVPALALLAWRTQDRISRTLTLVTIAYFAFFYVQARATFHHYIPAMLLPLVVLWRFEPASPLRRRLVLAGAGLAGAISLFLSWPGNAAPQLTARLIGMTVEDRTGGYERVAPEALRRAMLLHSLFPYDLEPSVPDAAYGGSPLAWNYYAHQGPRDEEHVNYVLQSRTAPPPAGMQLVTAEDDAAVYVKSEAVWTQHRAARPPTPAGAPIYVIPREMFFGPLPSPQAPHVIDVRRLLENLGVDVGQILARLGVRP
jgi:hypothetical protein